MRSAPENAQRQFAQHFCRIKIQQASGCFMQQAIYRCAVSWRRLSALAVSACIAIPLA
jgi:hypothetical protein